MVRATEPKSGRVATTLIFACTVTAIVRQSHAEILNFVRFEVIIIVIACYCGGAETLKFVCPMGAEDEFKLEEERVSFTFGEKLVRLEKIVVVLEAYL